MMGSIGSLAPGSLDFECQILTDMFWDYQWPKILDSWELWCSCLICRTLLGRTSSIPLGATLPSRKKGSHSVTSYCVIWPPRVSSQCCFQMILLQTCHLKYGQFVGILPSPVIRLQLFKATLWSFISMVLMTDSHQRVNGYL